LRDSLFYISNYLRKLEGSFLSREKEFNKILKSPLEYNEKFRFLSNGKDFVLPFDEMKVSSSVKENSGIIFKSEKQPICVTFENDKKESTLMFKTGDDLRTDQVIIQMIMIMNSCLIENGLDLSLITYEVKRRISFGFYLFSCWKN
jgi:phosphatidylinositol kinase/protein kinase (PI-3  family)